MKPKTNFELLHDLVMIYPMPSTSKTAGGLIVTEKMDPTAPVDGVVVSAGPGRLNKQDILIPMPVSVGDRVIFVKNNAKEIKHGGDTFLVVPTAEILCKVLK